MLYVFFSGYSRKLIWLEVFVTNKDPWITVKHFIESIENIEGNCKGTMLYYLIALIA